MAKAARPLPAIELAKDIVPIAEFKAHLSSVVRTLPARGRPVVITQNGKPAAVVLSPAQFDRLAGLSRFVEAVQDGLADAEAGRVIGDDQLDDLLDRRFGTVPPPRRRRR